jgi:hypothetical protein
MKGFKKTGSGPRYGSFAFSPKAGFSHSGTNKQNVRGYTRTKPKFAHGGMVTAPMASGDSSVIKRAKPVTSFDAEHGGKGSLRPGFNKGGKACYAEGGKVATTGAAIKMMKELMKRGNSAEDAATKAARRYGVSKSQVQTPSAPVGGGGLPADKQMLARGGMPMMRPGGGLGQGAPMLGRGAPQRIPMPAPAPQQMAAPAPQQRPMMGNHGYGSFGRRPLVR